MNSLAGQFTHQIVSAEQFGVTRDEIRLCLSLINASVSVALCLSLSPSVSLFLPLFHLLCLSLSPSVSLTLCLSQMMPISPSVCISFSLFFCNCLSLSPPVCHSLSLSLNFLFSPSALLSVCLSDCPSPFPWGVYLCSYSVISTQCDRADLSACWLKKDVFVFTFKGLLP